LEANKAEILEALPEEFHADLENEIQNAVDATALSHEEEQEAIKAELTNNPDIQEAEAIADLENNPTAHKPAPAPGEEDQKREMEERLAEAQAGAE
jgi:hypothetical protein